ncbi:hypothetical protein IYW40_09095 [Methylocystis sp. H4A]|uniref:hypothetical protein n=1 Tax=Methylocystis sp. H4A TaxID=2785788 RepID=UPI0018C25060|nr:hypothetical protein [Methylocystis sp. H4A]MBG0801639.1 hypothetical protein [Methylocystis sp. H4A]
MGVFSFLQPPKKGAPATQIAALEESLDKLRGEHKSVQAIVENHGQKRTEMLLSDASDADIVELDKAADLARIRLERLELAELELTDRLERARDKDARDRVASEHERAAAAIEEKAKALEGPINALAVAFAELVKAIPAETFLRKYSDRHTMAQPASPDDVARAILGNALYVAAPSIFETQKCRSAFAPYGAGVERALHVSTFSNGLMTPYNKGLIGEECAIHPAPVAADQLIVAPLRERARTLRDGVAERLEAAE